MQAARLEVVVDVDQLAMHFQRLLQAFRPEVEIFEIVTLQAVLIARIAGTAAGTDVLRALQEQGGAGDIVDLGAQPLHHLMRRNAPFIQWLERNEYKTGVTLRFTADEGHHALHRRIGTQDLSELLLLVLHRLERKTLLAIDIAQQLADVVLRQQALGDHDEQEKY